jgi:hypothetical protein
MRPAVLLTSAFAVACTPTVGSGTIDAPGGGNGSGSNSGGAVTLELTGTGTFGIFGSGSNNNNGPYACSTDLTVTGTFVSAGPVALNGGCQPDGTWTVTAALGSGSNACGTPPFANPYTYTVASAAPPSHGTVITYMGSDQAEDFKISGASDTCMGSFTHDNGSDEIILNPVTPMF